MIKAVIFDCFGVIIADGLEAVLLRLEQSDPSARGFVREIIHKVNRGQLSPRESHYLISQHLGMSSEKWQQGIRSGEVRNQYVIDLILELRKTYRTGLLSNVGKGGLSLRFSDAELQRLFDEVVISADVGLMKPEAEIYELAAQRLGVLPAECVFIDDRQPYVDGARRAGMQAILYQNFDQLKANLKKLLIED